MHPMDREILEEVFVDEYAGGRIRCVVPPGCWGANDHAGIPRRA